MPTEEEEQWRLVVARYGALHRTNQCDGLGIVTRILDNAEEMLRARGHDTTARPPSLSSAMLEAQPVLTGSRGGRPKTCVYLHTEERVNVKYSRPALETLGTLGPDGWVVIISIEGPTPVARRECDNERVQFMPARSLCYNLMRHCLVPVHTVVPDPPAGCTADALPIMLESDAVAQYHNWRAGTLLRIERRFGGPETTVHYRRVAAV